MFELNEETGGWYDPSSGVSLNDLGTVIGGGSSSSGGSFDLGKALGGINSLFQGTSPFGKAGAMIAAGGVGKLLENMFGGSQSGPAGYQGGIPVYTASRQQLPYNTGAQNEMLRLKQAAQDAMSTGATQSQVRDAALRTYGISPSQFDQAMQAQGTYRRPGQGGITYFTPMQYTATGKDMAAPAAGDVIGGGGLGSLPSGQPSGPTMRPLSAATGMTTPSTVPRASTSVPAPGTPERAAYERQLASQMTPEQFKELQASPYSVLSPSFNAALQANLAGQEELRKQGLTSQFGMNLPENASARDVENYLAAIQIERPMGGQITEDRDLRTLMSQYLNSLESGDVGGAFMARNRLRTLGVGPDVLNSAREILRPGINDKAYYNFYDPSNPKAQGLPMDLEGLFAPGGGGDPWAVVAQQKEKYGLTDDQIAYALGISPEDVKRALPKPPGAASGGYMPSGIAMLAGGGSGSRYLRGPGDGVSDSIPAKFERSGQPARLADGEFVIDARTVSELGNGSSEAGARKLYAMMDRVHSMRKQAKRGKPSGADRELNKLVRGK